MENLTKYDSLIGEFIIASGWHYDNAGDMQGVISKITKEKLTAEVWRVYVANPSAYSMSSFVFSAKEMDTLIFDKKLPIANKFLNTGTNALIK